MRLPALHLHLLGLGALLHDIGKLHIDDAILHKPGRLEPSEYEAMKRHTVTGEALVRESVVLSDIGPIVRGHHERIDGKGYPDGLVADEIPLAARIVSVCDAYDAMANTRQYRTGMGNDRAVAILQEHAGSQWDAAVVEALIQSLARMHKLSSSLEMVGRSDSVEVEQFCGCDDALPFELSIPSGTAVEAFETASTG